MHKHPLTRIAEGIAREFGGEDNPQHASVPSPPVSTRPMTPPSDEAANPVPFVLPADFGGAQRMILANRLYVASLDAPELYEGCEPESVFNLPGSEQARWLRVADEAIAALIEVPSV